MKTSQSTQSRNVVTGVVAILGFSVILGVGALSASKTPSAAAAGDSYDVSKWSDQIAAAAGQKIPFPIDQDLDYINTKSVVPIGSDDGATYWLASSQADELCVLVALEGPNQMVGATCGDRERLQSTGLGLQMNTEDGARRVYLIPDGYGATGTAGGLRSLTPNLLVGDPFAPDIPETEVVKATGLAGSQVEQPTVALVPFGEPEDYREEPAK